MLLMFTRLHRQKTEGKSNVAVFGSYISQISHDNKCQNVMSRIHVRQHQRSVKLSHFTKRTHVHLNEIRFHFHDEFAQLPNRRRVSVCTQRRTDGTHVHVHKPKDHTSHLCLSSDFYSSSSRKRTLRRPHTLNTQRLGNWNLPVFKKRLHTF